MKQDEKISSIINGCLTGRSTECYRKGTMMTVKQMGDLLGLKKTERYWLLHKNVFESRNIHGKTMVDVASFEKWYAGQIHYRKVTGEEPGELINAATYSIRDISEMLGISASSVYALIKREELETVTLDFRMRVPRETFDQWYSSQSHYRKTDNSFHFADIAKAAAYPKESAPNSFEFPEAADQKSKDNGIRKTRNAWCEHVADFITIAEAAEMAGVTRQAISRLTYRGKVPFMRAGGRILIHRSDFEKWIQDRKACHDNDPNPHKAEQHTSKFCHFAQEIICKRLMMGKPDIDSAPVRREGCGQSGTEKGQK